MINQVDLMVYQVKTGACDGRESNPGQLLGRQLCSPLYHHRWLHCYLLVLAAPIVFFQCHVFRESVARSYGGSSTTTATLCEELH